MRRTLVHAIAECYECDFREEDYNTAIEKGRAHANKTRHEVRLAAGYCWVINEAKKRREKKGR